VMGARGRKIRITLKENSPLLAEISALPEVYQSCSMFHLS
jgi:hypothetical protein